LALEHDGGPVGVGAEDLGREGGEQKDESDGRADHGEYENSASPTDAPRPSRRRRVRGVRGVTGRCRKVPHIEGEGYRANRHDLVV
jgi:hypothetical protein